MSSIGELTSLTRAILFVNKDVGAVGRTTSTEDLQIVAGQSETTRMQQICSCRQFLLLNIHDKNWTVVNFEQVCSFSQSSIYFYDDCRLGYLKKKWQWQMTKHLDSQQTEFCCNFFHEQCWRSWWQFPNFTKMNPVVNYCQSHSRIPRCFKCLTSL